MPGLADRAGMTTSTLDWNWRGANIRLDIDFERNGTGAAASAGVELDLHAPRDAPAGGASGPAIFDLLRGLAGIWRSRAAASRLDPRCLFRLPGVSLDVGGPASPCGHRSRPCRELCPQICGKRTASHDAAGLDRAHVARAVADRAGRAPPVSRPAPPPGRSARHWSAGLSAQRQPVRRAPHGRPATSTPIRRS